MSATSTIPITVEPEAAALLAELGMQAELEQMLEHARQTIPGLRRLRVEFAPAYDTGAEGITIMAERDPASRETSDWTWKQYSHWKITTFSPNVWQHFSLLPYAGADHVG